MIDWDWECDEDFWKFKEICTAAPILAYADFTKPFKLPEDACVSRLGAILCQNQNGINSVIGYVS